MSGVRTVSIPVSSYALQSLHLHGGSSPVVGRVTLSLSRGRSTWAGAAQAQIYPSNIPASSRLRAEHFAALCAMYNLTPGTQRERVLPEPYKAAWIKFTTTPPPQQANVPEQGKRNANFTVKSHPCARWRWGFMLHGGLITPWRVMRATYPAVERPTITITVRAQGHGLPTGGSCGNSQHGFKTVPCGVWRSSMRGPGWVLAPGRSRSAPPVSVPETTLRRS